MLCKMYTNQPFDLSSLSANSLEIIVWGACIGIIIAALLTIVYKTLTFSFIKYMIKNGVVTEDKACTVDEMNFTGKLYIKNELKYGYKSMRRYVVCANEDELISDSEKKATSPLPMDKARFYLPEEKRIDAEFRYTEVRNPVFSFVLTAVVAVVAAIFVLYAVPELMTMLGNFISMMNN